LQGADVPGDGPDTTGRRPRMQAVILVGFMGAGKSSVGRVLAEHLGWTFEDLDDRIERREKRKVAEIFRDAGEVGFRHAEHEALKDLLDGLRSGAEKVVALGGGAFVQELNIRLLAAAKLPTVFLDAGVAELWGRCQRQAEEQGMERPLQGSLEEFRDLYEKRRPHYLRASLRQETGGKAVTEIAAELVHALGLGRRRESEEKTK
jgi:shikimate kinase